MDRILVNTDISQIKKELDVLFTGIREEFDDHLESINNNTSEIEANYEYLCRLDMKMDKLNERLEMLENSISRLTGVTVGQPEQNKTYDLSEEEKDVFLVLYTMDKPVAYVDIAKRLRISEFLVRGYITNLVEKSIPIRKRYLNNNVYLELDARFREQQAKKNILNIRQKTVDQYF